MDGGEDDDGCPGRGALNTVLANSIALLISMGKSRARAVMCAFCVSTGEQTQQSTAGLLASYQSWAGEWRVCSQEPMGPCAALMHHDRWTEFLSILLPAALRVSNSMCAFRFYIVAYAFPNT